MIEARLKTADHFQMEIITTVNTEVDEKEMQTSHDCLGIPTILRYILQQFSTEELMTLSLVNKLWNFEARSVMKNRDSLRANISSKEDNTCEQLVAFGSALENMRVIPFSGIHVLMHHPRACQSILDGSFFKVILHRLPLKHFAVSFTDEWKQCENCFALQLVTTILADFCGVFEELSLHEGRYEFYQDILQDRRLSCLKTLKVKPGGLHTADEPLTSAFIKGLVVSAPNLQELHIDGAINFKENVLQGSSAVLMPTRPFRPLLEQVCEGLISSLRVNKMEILRIQNEEVDPELLNWFIPMVLAASRTTLKTLYIDVSFAVPLSYYGICLQNVTTLYIPLMGEISDNIEATISKLRLPRSLDRVFPKINQAGILPDQGHSYLWLSQAQTVP